MKALFVAAFVKPADLICVTEHDLVQGVDGVLCGYRMPIKRYRRDRQLSLRKIWILS